MVDSVLLPGAVVRAGAYVERTIVDDDVEIGGDSHVGGADAITLVGGALKLDAGARIAAGSVVPDDGED